MALEVLTAYGWLGLLVLVWLGLSIGSFLNVVIYRLPVMLQKEWRQQAEFIIHEQQLENSAADARTPLPGQADLEQQDAQQPGAPRPEAEQIEPPFNLMVPRSRCPHCNHQITALENIPVISWLVLRARCAECRSPISARYPGIEVLTALATLSVVAVFGFTPLAAAAGLFSWLLIAATFIDYDTKLLPDQLTYPLLWLGLLTNALTTGIVPLTDAVLGAAAGYLFLWLTFWAFKFLTGKEGMGYGDFKLFAALGAWMGWQALPSIILLAAVTGLAYALVRIVMRRQSRADAIPFGPFLAVAGWVTLMFRDIVLGLFLL